MNQEQRPAYDADTLDYQCSEEDYNNTEKTFGQFIDNGRAYEITDSNTPRPWLNYLCNSRFCSVISADALGFSFYKTSLLRITKYEHPVDYLPRDFKDGREIIITDRSTRTTWNAFRDAENVHCIHRPGSTTLTAEQCGIEVSMRVFVPEDDACECWIVTCRNRRDTEATLMITCEQTWTFSKFGIHTAEEGIPYLSTPGKDLTVNLQKNALVAHTDNNELPLQLHGIFMSPQAEMAAVRDDIDSRPDGQIFTFKIVSLNVDCSLKSGESKRVDVIAGADEDAERCNTMIQKYTSSAIFDQEQSNITAMWDQLMMQPSCDIPDKNMQNFLNIWLKNQLFLTFRYVRSGYIGYRDTLQDTWGYSLLDPVAARTQLLRTLSNMASDGSCPRNYPPFEDSHDLRRFMDSGTWIAMTLADYIKETGDMAILDERIPYMDSSNRESVREHAWKAIDLLYQNRGRHDLCLTGDGDWNDALEGISKCGDAESAWLTMALFHAQNIMAGLFELDGEQEKASLLHERSTEIKHALNEHAWDGDWYVYGFTGTGKPIGSKSNKEGRIHLNAQTWAIFTGLADDLQCAKIRAAVDKYLKTSLGPALLAPPYVHEAAEVGRIAKLEPGTFENGSVYQHAVTFKIVADCAMGDGESAYQTFANLLPTNPDNPDCRRTCEPYVMGNYYCGPGHRRFGQNFFTWFTGSPAWLLRAGFDHILGVRADYDGLRIEPLIPSSWDAFTVRRRFRGTVYTISFARAATADERSISINGTRIDGNLIPLQNEPAVDVNVGL